MSSSVTLAPLSSFTPRILSSKRVEPDNNHTNGLVKMANHNIGRATKRAMASGLICPMRLGTSSPNTIEKNVILTTTKPVANGLARRSSTPNCCNIMLTGGLKAASPTIPLSTPIEVMPICTADKKRVGSSPSRNAVAAAPSPCWARFCRRALRAATKAISDMAKKPFSKIKPNNMAMSM